MADLHDLGRFVEAQDADGTFAQALSELRAGRKRSHWIWFVFPQIAGLGQSAMSRRYAISSLSEAQAYLQHPVLGRRLRECTEALLELHDVSAVRVLGAVDAMKLRSSMTLFARGAGDGSPYHAVLERFFAGVGDSATDERI